MTGFTQHPPILNSPEEGTFEGFKQKVLDEWTKGSAINADRAAKIEFLEEIEFSPFGEPIATPIHEILGITYTRFGQQARELPLFAAVYRGADGSVFQVRLNQQWWDSSKNRYGKPYRFPKGIGSPLYKTYTDEYAEGAEKYVIFTEGSKKAESIASHGFDAVSLTGVNGGYNTDFVTKDKKLTPQMQAEIAELVEGKKIVVLAFDSDQKKETVNRVRKATDNLSKLIVKEIRRLTGCTRETAEKKVKIASWDHLFGKGIDDCLVNAGEQSWVWLKTLVETAPTVKQWHKGNRQNWLLHLAACINSSSLTPERVTTGRYIPDLPDLEPGAIHIVASSGTGDGKTTAIGRWVADNKRAGGFTIALYHANSVGQQTAETWDLPHRHDYKDNQNNLFLGDAVSRGGCVLCYDSLHRIPAEILEKTTLLVLDEANQGIAHLCEGGTLKERQSEIVTITANLMLGVIVRGGAIAMSEITVYDRTVDFVKQISGAQKVRLFAHKRSNFQPWDVELCQGSTSGFFAEAISALEDGKKLIFSVAAQTQGEKLNRLIAAHCPGKKIVRIDGKTNDRGEFADFWRDPNKWLETNGIPDLLILSPSGRSGVSITVPGFDEVWGHFSVHHPDMWQQMVGRYRLPVPRKVFAPAMIQAFGDERICSIRGVKRRLESNQQGFSRMYGVDMAERLVGQDEKVALRVVEVEGAIVSFLAAERTATGSQKATAIDHFRSLMKGQGHRITTSKIDRDDAVKIELVELKEAMWQENAAIMSTLQEEDGAKNIPTWHKELLEQKLRARREFPGVDFDDADDCLKALIANFGKIRRGVLLQAGAENSAAVRSLEEAQVKAILTRQIAMPHTLPRDAMKAQLLSLVGVLELLDGANYNNEDARAIAIKKAAWHWRGEIWYWLNLSIKDSDSPVTICNKLVKRLGLETESTSRPGGSKNRPRIYHVKGLEDPLRNKLLTAARKRLEALTKPAAEESPAFDESVVADALKLLAEAGDAREEVLEFLQKLPEPERTEVQLRMTRNEQMSDAA